MDRELDFTFYPMRRTTRRWGVHSMLYAAEPWAVISGSVGEHVGSLSDRRAAQSFVRQAREYFIASERADTIETRPLLYYYAFMNLAKALAMARGAGGLVGKVTHGVAVVGSTGHTANTAELQMGRSSPSARSTVDELHRALNGAPVPTAHVPVRELIAQSVVAHRMWREPLNRRERFLTVERIAFRHSEQEQTIWPVLHVRKDTMRSRGRGVAETLDEACLAPLFRAVLDQEADDDGLRTFELVKPVHYTARPSDVVMDVVGMMRPILWQTVTSAPPYRRFYLYLSPVGEQRLPQWLSIYSIFFWLGSLTRYQPVELLDALDGALGPFFREFLATQPSQLLYLLASEAKQQDVARAAVV